MAKFYHCIFILFLPFISICQETKSEPIPSKSYGVQIADEIEMENKFVIIDSIKLVKLYSKSAKEYYQTAIDDSTKWDYRNARSLSFSHKSDKKYIVNIPPLKPNEFYKLDVSYFGTDNIFTLMRMIHDEGNENWHTQDKKWMKMFRALNVKYNDAMLTFRPTLTQVAGYRAELSIYNFSVALTPVQKAALVNLTTSRFPNLKFPDVNSRGANKDDAIVAFAKEIKATGTTPIDFDRASIFEKYFECMDYEGIYTFYSKYFYAYLSDHRFDSKKYLRDFDKAVADEKDYYEALDDAEPNYLTYIATEARYIKTTSLSTFPSSFEQAYTNAIVPDFGYVIFDGFRNDFRGGSLFIGANISLKPSNKNVPLQLSTLDIWQRTAIHTGILTTPIDKGNGQREDLFQSSSLMLGLSYKVLNHAYRINVGGIMYRQIDPVTKTKSFAVAPYIGISIDIEIRKWLSGTFPGFKL